MCILFKNLITITNAHKCPNHRNPSFNGIVFNAFFYFHRDDVHDDDIIFEDFARLRLKGETEA